MARNQQTRASTMSSVPPWVRRHRSKARPTKNRRLVRSTERRTREEVEEDTDEDTDEETDEDTSEDPNEDTAQNVKEGVEEGVEEEDVFERNGPFRFLDLAPELRNDIYGYVFAENGVSQTYNIAKFKPPAITLVSRQLRQESLAHFFSQSTFILTVGCNYRHGHFFGPTATRDAPNSYMRKLMKHVKSRSGTLGFKKVMRTFVKTAGASAVFKNLVFMVQDSAVDPYWFGQVRYHGETNGRLAELRLNIGTGSILRSELWNWSSVRDWTTGRARPFDNSLDKICANAESVARDLTTREGFKGFTLSDLNKIAKAFRFEW